MLLSCKLLIVFSYKFLLPKSKVLVPFIILQTLHDLGARKFVLFGVGQIGCSPNALAQNSPDGKTCVARINSANQIFNNNLRALVDNFNNNFNDARFIYINTYDIFQDLIDNPTRYGNYSTHTFSINFF